MANHFFKAVRVGVKRRWWAGVRNGLAAVGGVWTLTELTIAALPKAKLFLEAHGTDFLELMTATFLVVFVAFVREPSRVTFKIPTTSTNITLKFGDLFAERGNLLIGVNEFFDGELGQAVKQTSVHGQFISRVCGGSAAAFRALVDPALAAIGAAPTPSARAAQPANAYPIGTTAVVANGAYKAFLMAMAHTDLANFKARSDVPTLWRALIAGFESVRIHGNGDPLAMPLFGNGQSGVNLEPQHLLRLLTLALVDFGRSTSSRLPDQVTVVLHQRCFEELDIREIARDWKRM